VTNLLVPRVSEQVRKSLSSEEDVSSPSPDQLPDDANSDQPMDDDMLEKVTIIASDEDQRIPRLMDYVKQLSDEGYSFRIVVDPEHEETMKAFHWEGEGIDEIISVEVEEIPESEYTDISDTSEPPPPPPKSQE